MEEGKKTGESERGEDCYVVVDWGEEKVKEITLSHGRVQVGTIGVLRDLFPSIRENSIDILCKG